MKPSRARELLALEAECADVGRRVARLRARVAEYADFFGRTPTRAELLADAEAALRYRHVKWSRSA